MFKNIYNSIENKKLFEKKILNKNIYCKYLIKKKDILYNFSHITVDNFFYTKQSTILFRSSLFKNNLLGHSLKTKNFKFKSVYGFSSFSSPFFLDNFSSRKVLNVVKDTFFNKNKLAAVLLFSVLKGGFKVYSSSGLIGFLPNSQLKKLVLNCEPYKLLMFLSIKNNKPFDLFWVLSKVIKIKIKSFSDISKNKQKRSFIVVLFFLK